MEDTNNYGGDGDPEMKAKPVSRFYFLLDTAFKDTHQDQYEHKPDTYHARG